MSLDLGQAGVLCVHVTENFFRHMVTNHVRNGNEPFEALLGAEPPEQLCNCWSPDWSIGDRWPVFETAVARIREEMVRSLLQPRVLAAEALDPKTRELLHRSWLLVLPCGAVAIMHHHDHSSELKTLYFMEAAVEELDPDWRWRAVMKTLVKGYAELTPEGWVPPRPDKLFPVPRHGVPREMRWQVRFISLEQWGFGPDQRGRLPDWS
jgi:hypothetical protein